MTTHRAVVEIRTGPAVRKAELVEVLKYIGKGWYRVKCIFLDDPNKQVHVRRVNIDETIGGDAK